MLLVIPGCASSEPSRDGLTSDEAVGQAEVPARAWSSDAILFAVIGVEHGSQAIVKSPQPHVEKADQGGRTFPCGEIDEQAWAQMDPIYAGERDTKIGDGRVHTWQVVYYSFVMNGGMAVLIRDGRPPACVADPLTAGDREELRRVSSRSWPISSVEAVAALRAESTQLDRALSESKDGNVSYGLDLRTGMAWGIKGQLPDKGILFSGTVDLMSGDARGLDVREVSSSLATLISTPAQDPAGGVAAILFAISQLLMSSFAPAPAPAPPVNAADVFQFPLSSWAPHCLGFGSQWRYCNGVALRACPSGAVWLHTGSDIKASAGAPVMAAADGVIIGYLVDSQFKGGVLIRHRTSFGTVITQYWHVWLRSGFISGSRVKRGQVFASIASMGTRTHFHFAVFRGEFDSHTWNGALPPRPGCAGYPVFPYKFVNPTAFIQAHSAA